MPYTDNLHALLKDELKQLEEEGCSVGELRAQFENLKKDDSELQKKVEKLYKKASKLKPTKEFPYVESSDLEKIRRKRTKGLRRFRRLPSDEELRNRIYGAWLGRSAGCLLGKPVEPLGHNPKMMIDVLKAHGAYPITDYLPKLDKEIPDYVNYQLWNEEYIPCARVNIRYMVRDDDMDYTILGLYYMEKFGQDFQPKDVADTWLTHLPYNKVYTAERVAYYNIINMIFPPESAKVQNPYREWIGAQIRADGFGYVSPGWPEKAAELAYKDASVSHVKNGIYGEMLMAAIISAALTTADIDQAIDAGLAEIPKTSRLYEAVQKVRQWVKEDNSPDKTIERIHQEYGHYHAVHTINNAALVIMGLCYSHLDYEKGIVLAVTGGYDTDCNGATVGSILGAMIGADALPKKWTNPLNNLIKSDVVGFNDSKISELAERTFQQAKKII